MMCRVRDERGIALFLDYHGHSVKVYAYNIHNIALFLDSRGHSVKVRLKTTHTHTPRATSVAVRALCFLVIFSLHSRVCFPAPPQNNIFVYGCDAKFWAAAPVHPSREDPKDLMSRIFPAQLDAVCPMFSYEDCRSVCGCMLQLLGFRV